MNLNDVISLMENMKRNKITVLDWEHAGSSLHLERDSGCAAAGSPADGSAAAAAGQVNTYAAAAVSTANDSAGSACAKAVESQADALHGDGSAEANSAAARPADQPGEWIKSPVVGVYYAAPSPDSDPFVQVGTNVETGTTLCIIEAMKLMNEVTSPFEGEIAEILVENGQRVEFGQLLFRII